MSFGFSVGDFLTAAQLAHKIRKNFNGAPSQFKNLSDETKVLSMLLQDVDIKVDELDLTAQQETNLEQAMGTCEAVLHDLQAVCDRFSDLDSTHSNPRKSVRRVWKKLKWEPTEADELRQRINSSIAMLTASLNQLSSATTVAVKKGVDRLNQCQDHQERLAILNWLSSFDHTAQQNDISARRQAGTGLWLLQSPEFASWRSTNGQTLFCPGIPGAGKTILSSIVVEELMKQFQDDTSVSVSYIYFNYQQQENQTIDQVFGSLLRQLVARQSNIPAAVEELYREHIRWGSKLAFEEVCDLIHRLSSLYSRGFIIVDALDECPLRDGRRNTILSEFMELQTTLSANIMCTSRPIPEIEAWFPKAVSVEVRASEHDVRKYLDGQFGRLPGFVARNPDLQEQVKSQIVQVVDGMFLLAHLHLESLMYKRTPKALRTALEGLPRGSTAYDDTYKQTMKRIQKQFPDRAELAVDVLQWIVCSKSPLTVSELQHALAVEVGEEDLDFDNLPDVDDMVTACGGLIAVDQESGIIRLVHYTTQEYFERTRDTWFLNSEDQMTEVCLTYLSFNSFRGAHCHNPDEYRKRLQDWPFYRYACKHWGMHAHQTPPARILAFFQLEQAFRSSLQPLIQGPALSIFSENYEDRFCVDPVKEQTNELHVAAHFGLVGVVRELAVSETVDEPTSRGWTPLAFAAAEGQEAVIRQLLVDYESDANSRDSEGMSPLHRAAINGHGRACETLLDIGRANVNLLDSNSRTALSHAAERNSTTIVDILLRTNSVYLGSTEFDDRLALCSSKTGAYRSPMFCAVEQGDEEMVKRLLATNRVNLTTSLFRSAISNSHLGVAKILLDSDVFDADATDKNGRNPLSYAADQGYVEAVEVLLQRYKADVNSKDYNQTTPLSHAVESGHEQVVKLLLQTPGVDVNSKDLTQRTPLSYAAEYGRQQIVEALLQSQNIDVNAKDRNQRTPLSYASEDGHEQIVEALLQAPNIDIDSKAADLDEHIAGRTPLSFAAEGGHSRIVQRLLETGHVDPDACGKGSHCRTPLTWAILGACRYPVGVRDEPERFMAVVDLLLRTKRVDVNYKSRSYYYLHLPTSREVVHGHTPLLIATKAWGPPGIIKLLLENGADANGASEDGAIPLSHAAKRGDKALVDLLIEYGAKPVKPKRRQRAKGGWNQSLVG
ncbi:hypothetical protein MRS44_012894 [Fusarium solani]|uniref:uncharacterized protein n=1 Tax=Fusarium solani TaxID=169388 RepID=UPI0032C493D4|nr:hypothetical protein MRS44_012894 [Fusarium solani]